MTRVNARAGWLFLCWMLAVACVSPTGYSSAGYSSGPSGRLVFDRGFDIWTMTVDGMDLVRLTEDPAEDFDAAWSPDGSLIAFRSHRDGNEEVYVMAADGSGQTNLTSHPESDYSPAWSPDGSLIAFATDRDPDSGGNDIYIMRADGSGLVRLTVGGGIDEYPTWSPDGSQIAYACTGGRILPGGNGDFEICLMEADGSNQRQLTDAPGVSGYPAWSPDGSSIAFMSTRGGWPTLPAYVPPGYEEGEYGEHDIYVMDTDGGNPRNLTNNGRESEEFPNWSPDGEFLVLTRYGCLVIIRADGSEAIELADTTCEDVFPHWTD